MASYFNDETFQETLLAFIVRDRGFLEKCSDLLDPADFRPNKSQAIERWVIAERALSFWKQYKHPIGKMLKPEIIDYAAKANLSTRKKEDILYLVKKLRKIKLIAGEAIEDKVIEFKKEKIKNDSIQTLIDLQAQKQLTDEKWLEICNNAVQIFGRKKYEVSDYLSKKEFRLRQEKRDMFDKTRYPLLMIDPLDQNVRAISYGHTGLVTAPYKRGKSLFMVHLGLAYPIQGLNVLYFTLEDPKPDVEDRFDAAISALPIHKLGDLPKRLEKRFMRQRELMRGRIRIADCTGGGYTLAKIEDIYLDQRNQGFDADVLLLDYDEFIESDNPRLELRLQSVRLYTLLQQRLAAKYNKIVWIASQSDALSEDAKIVGGTQSAEDKGKARKVAMQLGLGQGEWGEESIFLWVGAHKYDRMKIGWNIMTDKSRMMFYDRERTLAMMEKEAREKEESEKWS